MKIQRMIAWMIIIVILLAGCAETPASSQETPTPVPESIAQPESSQTQTASSDTPILEQMDELYARLDTSPLPLQEWSFWMEPESANNLPKQLIIDSPEAYEYAALIYNFFYYAKGNILEEFDDPSSMYMPAVVQTALYHTTPIQLQWEEPYPDHAVYWLLRNEQAEQRGICDLYYAADVQATIRRMFGEGVEVYDMSVEPYVYYDREKLYARIGDYGGPWWVYPMITALELAGGGMVCEVVPVSALDSETPTMPLNGEGELTAENFEALTASSEKYRYTFAKGADGQMALKKFEMLRQQAES